MAKWPVVTKWPLISAIPPVAPSLITSVSVVEWLRSDLGYTAGATQRWVGQIAGTTLSQGTAANQPTYSASDAAFNGRPSLTADGTNDSMTSTLAIPFPGTTARYYWFIFKAASTVAPAANGALFSGNTNQCEQILQMNSGDGDAGKMIAYNATARTTGISTPATAKRGTALFTNSTSDRFSLGGTSVTGTNTGNTQDGTGWGIFSHGGADTFFAGSLAEVLILAGAPTAAEQAALDAYAVYLYGSSIAT